MKQNTTIYKTLEVERIVRCLYDKALERWPVPFEEKTVRTRYGETFVIASGDPAAAPLVLLHGANSNALAWLGDIERLAASFRVYAVDIIGEPGRSAPSRPPWAGSAYAEWLEDVLDGLGHQNVSLMGISQGGWTALKLATSNPERVSKLVLLAPGGIVVPRLSFLLRAIPLSMLGRRGARAINRIVFGDQPIHEDAVRFMDVIMTHVKPRIGAMPMYRDEELGRLTMPVLFIGGARDALIDAEKTAARMKTVVPHLEVRILPEAGHVLHGFSESFVPFLLSQSPDPRLDTPTEASILFYAE